MRRIDILKMQLLNSRGRFFTASWVGQFGVHSHREMHIKENIKVIKILRSDRECIVASVYVPRLSRHQTLRFWVNFRGDCTYLASDKSKIEMSGQKAFNF